MSTRTFLTTLTSSALLGLFACAREDADGLSESMSKRIGAAASAQTWITGVSVRAAGSDPAAARPAGVTVRAGEPIAVDMGVSGLPANTTVTVRWVGPGGQVQEQHSEVGRIGQDRMHFVTRRTQDWPAGDYQAEVWVGDRKVHAEAFRVAVPQ